MNYAKIAARYKQQAEGSPPEPAARPEPEHKASEAEPEKSARALAILASHKRTRKQPEVNESQRAVDVERRDYSDADLTDRYKRGAAGMKLRPIQSQALRAIEDARGGLFPLGVGHGKTLISILAGVAIGARNVIVLLPPALVGQFGREWAKYAMHWQYPPKLQAIAYTMVSSRKNSDLLDREKPDLIVADEAHALKDRKSARTRRLLRYLDDNPECMFVALSGTMTSKSLFDFGHLAKYALRDKSPMPTSESHLERWARCIDVKGQPNPEDWAYVQPLSAKFGDGRSLDSLVGQERKEHIRHAFRERLTSAPGVVATVEGSVDCSLVIERISDLRVPDEIAEAIELVTSTAQSPDSEEFYEDDIAMARALRQLSAGFWYRWAWEETPLKVRDDEWLGARRDWHRYVRDELNSHAYIGYDSPFLVYQAVAREHGQGQREAIHKVWQRWSGVKDRVKPPTVAVWISEYLVDDAVERAHALKAPCVIWYDSKALEEALVKRGVPCYGAGTDIPATAKGVIALSIKVHHKGRNMQAWSRQIVLEPPSSGSTWEQLLGRMHRAGQEADEVYCAVYTHTDAFERAFKQSADDALYIEQATGSRQKLCYATTI